MHRFQRSGVEMADVERLVEEIDKLVKQADHELSARDVQKKLNNDSPEAIAKALRTAIERGRVEITKNMKLQVGTPFAALGQ